MEKKLLLEKLESYKLMKQDIEKGELPQEAQEKIDMIEKEIEDLRAQQEEIRKSVKDDADKDLAKVDHYIELLEMLIAEALDDDIREEADEAESEVIEDDTDIKEDNPVEDKLDEQVEEAAHQEELRQEPSRFPSFNIR